MRTALLHAACFTPTANGWGLPVLFEGGPGVAKTSVIRAYARRCGWLCEVLSPSARGEGAFGVVPVPREVDGHMELDTPPPAWGRRMNARGTGLILCDEVTCAPQLLQAPMLSLMTDRYLAGLTFAPRVRVIGACNLPSKAANGHDLAPALANRFGWVTWGTPTVDEHRAFMLACGEDPTAPQKIEAIDAEAEERRVLAAWPDAWAAAVGLESAFLGNQPQWKNREPKDGDARASRAWPSDRSWYFATCAMAAAIVHQLGSEDRDDLVRGFVGAEASEALHAFNEYNDLPNTAELLDGKVTFAHKDTRVDRTSIVLHSALAMVVPPDATNRIERARVLWKLCDMVGTSNLDVVVPIVYDLHRNNLGNMPEAVKLASRVYDVVQAR